jgi:predicted DNA-binding protein YlxM (UPF0122 family)
MESMKDNMPDINPETRKLLMEIFGTDREEELKQIAVKSQRYDQMFQNRLPINIRNAGRKALFTEKDISTMEEMYHNGHSIQEIAAHFCTTRQTVSKYITLSRKSKKNRFITMRMQYMHEKELCTTIDIDFMHRKIYIRNHTDDIIHRAFGVVVNPTWEDFEDFLERRCFPKTRANIKNILRDIGVSSYDPLQIIEKTQGRMAEDKQWIKISYPQKREDRDENDQS